MLIMSTISKPKSEIYRPELVFLPSLGWVRRLLRWILKFLIYGIVTLLTRVQVEGRENLPTKGPVLFVSNHLGDADAIIGLAFARVPFDLLGKTELYDVPILGTLMHAYGTIWVHRGQPDRKAIRAALDGLTEGRMVAIAPEGRESLSGALEEGTSGAAYLALKADVAVQAIVFTGTENQIIYGNLRTLRRTPVTITIGKPFRLVRQGSLRQAVEEGTRTIMITLAQMLPPEYRGVYRDVLEREDGSA
jgi:1-acyl-sn-glycerol-3-phosphate acyltransferase